MRLAWLAAALLVALLAPPLGAEPGRPSVEERFAPKRSLFWFQLGALSHLRDDFYESSGAGLTVGYFPWESLGVELRGALWRTRLSRPAEDLRQRVGLVPDASPQRSWALAGVRWAPAYGKILWFGDWLMHLDPQLVFDLGVARADERVLPTGLVAISAMTHWRWGIKANFDLGLTAQLEQRQRGWTTSFGWAPAFGLGWGVNF